jgi:tellurite resistance protein
MAPDESLLDQVAATIGLAPQYGAGGAQASILAASAVAYGSLPQDDATQPTGFDPDAAALFEAVVESAFLVANADGDFDETEQRAFQHVVLTACNGRVAEKQVNALLADLHDLLQEDGMDKRIRMVARHVRRVDHANEVLRVAALIAAVSSGVSVVEREVMSRLAGELKLDQDALVSAIEEAERALAGSGD